MVDLDLAATQGKLDPFSELVSSLDTVGLSKAEPSKCAMVERQNKWNVQTYCRLSESYRVHLFPLTTKTASPSQVLCFLYCGFRLQVLHKWVENRTISVCAPLHHPVLVALHHRNSGGPIVLYGLPLSSGIVQVMLV